MSSISTAIVPGTPVRILITRRTTQNAAFEVTKEEWCTTVRPNGWRNEVETTTVHATREEAVREANAAWRFIVNLRNLHI